MKAYIFSGQGAQFIGMGKELCQKSSVAKEYFDLADRILDFDLSRIMTSGTEEELKQTRITQPAVFVYSVVKARIARDFKPAMVAGHSLGEFSALAATRALSFADALRLVYQRAMAMQAACETQPGTMAAVLGLEDTSLVEIICQSIEATVVPANYNCPGQLVISGSREGIAQATERLKEAGARRVLPLNVGGAFHSPLMLPAQEQLAKAIRQTTFKTPICPIYQNVNSRPEQDPEIIKENLIAQLTAPVQWIQTIENMVNDGAIQFVEVGPKSVLSAFVKKINSRVSAIEL
ncbi:MAG: ACP S-malonyltransferase [Sphingobacteriales bacterium]|nr:ACP S-malonyltransferase [Sphingobacteriales bacterium]